MNFKETIQGVDTVCCMLKKHVKTHSVQLFSRPPKTILKIWPTDIFFQSVNMLHVQKLYKQQKIKINTETDKLIIQTEKS
jgi:hypothetical protein